MTIEPAKISLSSFIRVCLLDTSQRIHWVEQRRNASSGYDFYQPLYRSIRAHVKGESPETVDEILQSPKNAKEREYNLAAFNIFLERFGSKRSLELVNRRRVYKLPDFPIEIVCDPVFATTEGGVHCVHAIWAARSPDLVDKYASVACLLLRECYRGTTLANSSFAYANLVTGRRIRDRSISNSTTAILRTDARTISQLIFE